MGRVEAMGVEEESRQVGGALPRRRRRSTSLA
jgi:hypothetical protein